MKENLPLISIILPVYNGEKFLDQAIQSCLDQTYINFELLIVNDASSDRSLEIAREFGRKDKRIKVLSNTKNLKLPGSLNRGHKAASGSFITWTSDDNLLKSDFLEILVEEITNGEFDIVYSDFDIIWENGELKRTHKAGPLKELIFGDTIGASFLYKREVFRGLNGFNEDLFLVEDYDFFLRASLRYNFGYLNKSLYNYRLHRKSLSSRIEREKDFTKIHERALFEMFTTVTAPLKFRELTINFIIDLYFKKPINLVCYFSSKSVIKEDLQKFEYILKKSTGENVIDILHDKIFWNLYNQKAKVSFLELLKILISERKILYNKRTKSNAVFRFCFQVFGKSLVNPFK